MLRGTSGTYHTKDVNGKARHSQRTMEEDEFGFCEAITHFLNISTQSKLSPFTIKTQLAASDAEERTKAMMANVRGYILYKMLSIWRKATESLSSEYKR